MDQPNTPNNLPTPTNEPSDLSYLVMPQQGQHHESASVPAAPARPAQTGPVPPRPAPAPFVPSRPSQLPMEEEISIWRNKWVYVIGGAIVLLILGVLIYFMVNAKKSSSPTPAVTTTKLPKVWLQQYFTQNLDSDGNCNDQTICGDDADPDSDGLKNYDEFKAGTSPAMADTDNDGLADGDEVNIYKTDPTLKYTDRRDVVAQNNWTDGYQIKNGYDPLTPGLKFSDERKTQIATDTSTYTLHEPTITTLGQNANQTGNQQTYTNSVVGFSFKYPADWTINDDGKGDVALTDSKTKYTLEGGEISPIVVQFSQDNSGASIDKYLTGGRAPMKSILKTETVKIGGKTAYVLQGTTAPVYHDDRLVFYNDYVISFGSNGTTLKDQDVSGSINKTFDEILASVNFVN